MEEEGAVGPPDSWVPREEGNEDLDFGVPAPPFVTPIQVAGSSNPFLSRLLNRDTITRISYKSESQLSGGGDREEPRGLSQGPPFHSGLLTPADDAYFLQDLSLELLFPDSFGFITYQGSLSTPPCSETVTWILIDRALNITSLQVTSQSSCHHWDCQSTSGLSASCHLQ